MKIIVTVFKSYENICLPKLPILIATYHTHLFIVLLVLLGGVWYNIGGIADETLTLMKH